MKRLQLHGSGLSPQKELHFSIFYIILRDGGDAVPLFMIEVTTHV